MEIIMGIINTMGKIKTRFMSVLVMGLVEFSGQDKATDLNEAGSTLRIRMCTRTTQVIGRRCTEGCK